VRRRVHRDADHALVVIGWQQLGDLLFKTRDVEIYRCRKAPLSPRLRDLGAMYRKRHERVELFERSGGVVVIRMPR
jgi:hypothetical protein